MSRQRSIAGAVDDSEEPSLKQHSWANDWLNHSNGEKTCATCGCTVLRAGAIIRADMQTGNGRGFYEYIDCMGRPISSTIELSCPVFAGVGSGGSGSVEAKEVARRARVEALRAQRQLGMLEARIVQLEADNAALREHVSSVTQIDLTQLAAALLALAQKAKSEESLEAIELRGQSVKIPKQLVEVIDVVAVREEDQTATDALIDGCGS